MEMDYNIYQANEESAKRKPLSKPEWERQNAQAKGGSPTANPAAAPAPPPPEAPRNHGPHRADLDVASLPPKGQADPASPAPQYEPVDAMTTTNPPGLNPPTTNPPGLPPAPAPKPAEAPAPRPQPTPPETPAATPPAAKPPATPPRPAATSPQEPAPQPPAEGNGTAPVDNTDTAAGDNTDTDTGGGKDLISTAMDKLNNPNSSKLDHKLGDSLKKVLGIDANTSNGMKNLKYLLYGLSAFASGFAGKDDAIMKAAVDDFRAKRDAENTAEAKKLEQDELAKNIKTAYPELTTSDVYKLLVEFGNAATMDKAHTHAKELQEMRIKEERENLMLIQKFNADEAGKGRAFTAGQNALDRQHASSESGKDREHAAYQNALNRQQEVILQNNSFASATSTLDQAHRNTMAQMIAAAGISAEQAPRALIEMAKAAGAYDSRTGKINSQKLGSFMNATGGDTIGKRAYETFQGVLNTVASAATKAVIP